jgi:hypothetical protein
MTELWCIKAFKRQPRRDDIVGTSWYATRKEAVATLERWMRERKDVYEMHLVRGSFNQRTKTELWLDALNNVLDADETRVMQAWNCKNGKKVKV